MAQTLSEYYQSQGQALPSVAQRQETAKSAGIQNYSGTAQQNSQLLNYLSSNATPSNKPVVSSNTGVNVNSGTMKPQTAINITQPQPAVQNATLNSDLQSGIDATNRAKAEENAIALAQGQKAPYPDLAQGNVKTTPTVDNTMATTDVNGINAQSIELQKQGLIDAMTNRAGEVALTANEYAGTVDPAKAELSAINQQMNEESLAGRRRQEAVLQIPGITKEQAQDKINEISRNNTSKLADLAVVQMAKQGAYDSAKEIADRAVQVKLEVQKNKLDALSFAYQENKEIFTKAEQRAFETAQADRERKLNAEEKNLQRISDLSLQALADGAPTSVVTKMRNAKTEAEAIAIGGSYIGRNDRRLQEAQIASANRANQQTSSSTGILAQLNDKQQVRFGQLTDDFDKETKAQRTILNSSQNIQSLAERAKAGEPTAQVALIFSYMKSLDPTSTVREGEYATAKNTTGLPGKVLNTYNSVLSGNFLNNKQIDGYVADASALANRADSQIQNIAKEYDRRANVYGIPSGLVYQSSGVAPTTQQVQIAPEKEQAFNKILGITTPAPLPSNSVANALFGNQATNKIIPFNLNNFKK